MQYDGMAGWAVPFLHVLRNIFGRAKRAKSIVNLCHAAYRLAPVSTAYYVIKRNCCRQCGVNVGCVILLPLRKSILFDEKGYAL